MLDNMLDNMLNNMLDNMLNNMDNMNNMLNNMLDNMLHNISVGNIIRIAAGSVRTADGDVRIGENSDISVKISVTHQQICDIT